MKRYIALVMPSHDQGSIIGVADDLDMIIWTDDVTVVDTVSGDLYTYEGEAWRKTSDLNEDEYDVGKLVAATLGYASTAHKG